MDYVRVATIGSFPRYRTTDSFAIASKLIKVVTGTSFPIIRLDGGSSSPIVKVAT